MSRTRRANIRSDLRTEQAGLSFFTTTVTNTTGLNNITTGVSNILKKKKNVISIPTIS